MKLFSLVFFGLMFVGCATGASNGFVPLEAGETVFRTPLFVAQMPEGAEWRRMLRQDGSLHLTKQLEKPGHTFFLSVTPVAVDPQWSSPSEFMAWVKRQKDLDSDSKRFKFRKNEYILDRNLGEYGFRYHVQSEDHGVPSFEEGHFLIMDIRGFGIMHPQERRLYYDVNYSERYLPGDADPALARVGEKFITGFRVASLSKAGDP